MQYVDDVLSGKQVCTAWVRQQVQNHVDDLARQDDPDYPYYFDDEHAAWFCSCFPTLLVHTQSEFSGEPFRLLPWQEFVVSVVFGWKKKENDYRRYTHVYLEMARKQGKSTFLSAIALMVGMFDGESAGQIYSAATTKAQAKQIFSEASRMVNRSLSLKKKIQVNVESLYFKSNDTIFKPLSSDVDGLDGLNSSLLLIDELHKHPSRNVYVVLDTSTGARPQPLTFCITTAGDNNSTFCLEMREMVIGIINKNIQNDSWFGFICGLESGDDYKDERVWEKANPSIHYIPTMRPMIREQCSTANRSPSAMNTFLRNYMNKWTQQYDSWIHIADWDKCRSEFRYEDMLGRPCIIGLDMSDKLDLSAACLLFPPIDDDDDKWRYLWQFWLPEATIEKYVVDGGEDRYKQWVDDRQIIGIPGPCIRSQPILDQIKAWAKDFDVQRIAADRAKMHELEPKLLEEGFDVEFIEQTSMGMTEGTTSLEAQIVSRELEHTGASCIRWQIENAAVKKDTNGNTKVVKPNTRSQTKKIDGVIAGINALESAKRNPIEPQQMLTPIFF